ncbi:9896_t:CDS:2 [Gigaspora margarita]|uniref:9896_t:CDS:1 n=1 Tax=Gigaspora margarita TaxID=4874 RepID=A0ABN7UF42_GIGMA|nr:9896_t:CDS:2 [Gigaspora margarita]
MRVLELSTELKNPSTTYVCTNAISLVKARMMTATPIYKKLTPIYKLTTPNLRDYK